MTTLFIDMDGVLAKWQSTSSFDEVCAKDYFTRLEPQENLIAALKKLSEEKDVNLSILSMANCSPHAAEDKHTWLDKFCPFIKNRILIKDNRSKGDFVKKSSFLLDDYTKNLTEFEACGGVGIKFYNEINNTNRTWGGYVINERQNSESLYKCLCAYLGV